MKNLWLSGVAYELGEHRGTYNEVDVLNNVLSDKNLPPNSGFLGIGSFYKIVDLYKVISSSVAKTLEKSKVKGIDIDRVIFCSSKFHQSASVRNKGYAKVLQQNEISPKSFHCISGTACVSLLSSIQIAIALSGLKCLTNTLIINVDYVEVEDDLERVYSHVLLSDAVSSVILSDQRCHGNCLRLVDYKNNTDVGQMISGTRLQDFKLGRTVIKSCLGSHIQIENVEKIFSDNIFEPLKKLKEKAYGFSECQLFLDNVIRTGHCFGSDILINLSDFLDSYPNSKGDFLLYSESNGHLGCLLISCE